MAILNQEQGQPRTGYSNQVLTAATLQQEWPSHAGRALFILPSGSQASSRPHSAPCKSPEKPGRLYREFTAQRQFSKNPFVDAQTSFIFIPKSNSLRDSGSYKFSCLPPEFRFLFPGGPSSQGEGGAIDRGLSKGVLQILGLLLKIINAPNH